MKITKEQVLELNECCLHGESGIVKTKLKQWFPKAFEVKLEVGKWYKFNDETPDLFLGCIIEVKDDLVWYHGFNSGGKYQEKDYYKKSYDYILATNQEVESALIAEAKKLGFEEGVWFEALNTNPNVKNQYEMKTSILEYRTEYKDLSPLNGFGIIFRKGQWATIIPTMTIKEAEEKLNCKII